MIPNNWTLVRGARQLVTLHQLHGPRRAGDLTNLGVIPDGSVLLRNGVIEAVGPTRRIENMAEARNAKEIDATGRVVMPAFVDCHACVVPAPAYQGDASPETYRGAAARRVQTLPAARMEAQADDLLRTMARHGTATVGALSGYGFDCTGELKILRVLRALNRKPLDIVSILFPMSRPSEAEESGGDYQPLWAGEELLHGVKRRKLAAVAQVQCGHGAVSRRDAECFWGLARSLGFGVGLEMLPEHDPGLVDAAILMQALSITVLGPLRKSEMESLAFSPAFAILLPALQSYTGSMDYVRQLIDAGGLIALASGIGPESGSTASMQAVVQQACERLHLSVEEAISATTINAACALGLGSQTGSLEHGKLADLILLNASDYREIPLLKGTNLTYSLIKRGVVVFQDEFPGWSRGTRFSVHDGV